MANVEEQKKIEGVSQDEDSGVSMVEVLEEEAQLEADAKAVLGDSDDKNCTYPLGYIPRQALYACITCVTPIDPPAGVCLACSYECHEGHELVELYTKRNFRCDCGNNRFKDKPCKLCPDKKPQNADNSYNQNFSGKYCTCHRPYPDPDDDVEDEMIQCVVCEDWYHGRHLQGKVPEDNDYDEMICQGCMKKHEFLWAYSVVSEVVPVKKEETNKEIDIEGVTQTDDSKVKGSTIQRDAGIKTESSEATQEKADNQKAEQATENKSTSGPQPGSSSRSECLLLDLEKGLKDYAGGATFWHIGWRNKLCKCDQCRARYEAASVNFITDQEDTVHAYEERGKKKHGTGSNYDQGMQALNNMNRVQQVEVIHGYNNLKTELKDYLKRFVENGKTVREEDIREFFSSMEARKRQRVGGMQWNCK